MASIKDDVRGSGSGAGSGWGSGWGWGWGSGDGSAYIPVEDKEEPENANL